MAALEATSSLGSINWCSHVHMSVALPAKTLQERKSTLFKMPSREAHNPPLRHSWSPEVTSLGHQVKQTQFPVLGVSSMTIPPKMHRFRASKIQGHTNLRWSCSRPRMPLK